MDRSKFLTTVCVLTIMVGHVSGQSCVRSNACFAELDIYTSVFGVKTPVWSFGKMCDRTTEVTRCYSEFVNCPDISLALPGANTVQVALTTFCQIKDVILPCVSASLILKVLRCVTSLTGILSQGDRPHSNRTLAQFIPCLSAAFEVCGDERITSSFESIENLFQQDLKQTSPSFTTPTRRQSQPSSTTPKHSGCMKLGSWPFLGVIATLISSRVKGF